MVSGVIVSFSTVVLKAEGEGIMSSELEGSKLFI